MNILFTYITPFNPERGGIGRVTDSLTKEFQKRGHKVFYLIYPSYMNPFGVKDVENYKFPTHLSYIPDKDLLSNENESFYFNYLKRNKINIVINQSGTNVDSFLWVKSKDLGIPIISCIHQFPLQSYQYMFFSYILPLRNDTLIEKIKRIARLVIYKKLRIDYFKREYEHYKKLLPETSYLCLLSDKYYSKLEELKLPFNHEDKIIAIPNPNSYRIAPLIDLSKKKKQLLYVGFLNAAKGPERLIKIWKRLYKKFPDWEMIIVGSGEKLLIKRLKRLASNLPRIRFEGLQKPDEYYMNASIFCMTSNYEGWPMVIPEAMQNGCVPVAFNSFAAIQDLIQDGQNGFLIKPFSINEYTKKLEILIINSTLRFNMAQKAMESITKFNIDKIADSWESLFKKINS